MKNACSEPGAEPQRFLFKDGRLHPVVPSQDPQASSLPQPGPIAGIVAELSAEHAGASSTVADWSGTPLLQHPAQSEAGAEAGMAHHNPFSEAAASPLSQGSTLAGGIGEGPSPLPNPTPHEASLLMQLPALLASAVASGKSGAEVTALQQALVASAQREWETLAGLRSLPGVGHPSPGPPLSGLPPQHVDWNAALSGQGTPPGGLSLEWLRNLQPGGNPHGNAGPSPSSATDPALAWLYNLQAAAITPAAASPGTAAAAYPSNDWLRTLQAVVDLGGVSPSPASATAPGLHTLGGHVPAHTIPGFQGHGLGPPHLPSQGVPPGLSQHQEQAAVVAQWIAAMQRGTPLGPNPAQTLHGQDMSALWRASQLGATHPMTHAPSGRTHPMTDAHCGQDPAALLASFLAGIPQGQATPGCPTLTRTDDVTAAHTHLQNQFANPPSAVTQGFPDGLLGTPWSMAAGSTAGITKPSGYPGVPASSLHTTLERPQGVPPSPADVTGATLSTHVAPPISLHVSDAPQASLEALFMHEAGIPPRQGSMEINCPPGMASPRSPAKRAAPLAALLARMGGLSSPRKSALSGFAGPDSPGRARTRHVPGQDAPGRKGSTSPDKHVPAGKSQASGTHDQHARASMEFGNEGPTSPQIPIWWKSPQRPQAGNSHLEIVARQNAAAILGNRPTFPGSEDAPPLAASPAQVERAPAGSVSARKSSATSVATSEPPARGGSESLRVSTQRSQESGMQTSPSMQPALDLLDEPSSPMVDVHINPLFSAEDMAAVSTTAQAQPTTPKAAVRPWKGSELGSNSPPSRAARLASPHQQPAHPHTTGRSSAFMPRTVHTPSHGTGLRRQASMSALASQPRASPLQKRFDREGPLNILVRGNDQNQSTVPARPHGPTERSAYEGSPLLRTGSRMRGSGNEQGVFHEEVCQPSAGLQLSKEVEAIHALNLRETEVSGYEGNEARPCQCL
jgi:hypothetical protein